MTTDFGNEPVRPVASRKTNTLAIASLVCSVLSLLTCCIPRVGIFVCIGLALLGAILGYVAMGQIKRTGEQGNGLALAGTIIGAVVAVISIVLLVLAFAFGVALLKNMQNLQNQPNIMPGIEQPGDVDVFEGGDDLGEPAVTPDATDDTVPEPVTPGDADATDSATDTDPDVTTDAAAPDPANQ
jgi:peptidyl-prolyl cis-trans isomerase B (cyclophilin B)